jgi:hypothetical protein
MAVVADSFAVEKVSSHLGVPRNLLFLSAGAAHLSVGRESRRVASMVA